MIAVIDQDRSSHHRPCRNVLVSRQREPGGILRPAIRAGRFRASPDWPILRSRPAIDSIASRIPSHKSPLPGAADIVTGCVKQPSFSKHNIEDAGPRFSGRGWLVNLHGQLIAFLGIQAAIDVVAGVVITEIRKKTLRGESLMPVRIDSVVDMARGAARIRSRDDGLERVFPIRLGNRASPKLEIVIQQ